MSRRLGKLEVLVNLPIPLEFVLVKAAEVSRKQIVRRSIKKWLSSDNFCRARKNIVGTFRLIDSAATMQSKAAVFDNRTN